MLIAQNFAPQFIHFFFKLCFLAMLAELAVRIGKIVKRSQRIGVFLAFFLLVIFGYAFCPFDCFAIIYLNAFALIIHFI